MVARITVALLLTLVLASCSDDAGDASSLSANGTNGYQFLEQGQFRAALIEGRRGASAPLIGLAQAGADGFFDDGGFPMGGGWDEVRFPGLGGESVYALEITGDSMEPAYREGDRIIVAPGAQVRKGDRVVAKTSDGEVMAKVLGRQTETQIELISLNPDHPVRTFKPSQIIWIARILWVSQ